MFISAFIFECRQDRSHQPTPYPLNFRATDEARQSYPRFSCTSVSSCLEATAPGRCLVSAPCAEIKLQIYCSSIKQQERSYFRQLIVREPRFTSCFPNARHAYLPLLPAVKSKQPQHIACLKKVYKSRDFFFKNKINPKQLSICSLEIKKLFCVVVRDIFNHLCQERQFGCW